MGSRLLILDNYDSFTWNLVQLVREVSELPFDIIKNDKILINDIQYFDKILFSPGPGLPKEVPVMKEIIENYKNSKSILGICLGHQAIAEAFGCKLINLNVVSHGQQQKIKIIDESDYLLRNIPQNFTSGLYHSWVIDPTSLSNEIKIIAVSENGHIMGISHNQYDIKGLQFHPESCMTPLGSKIIRNWLSRNLQRATTTTNEQRATSI
jgi:anthranilate synthase component II